MASQKRKYNVVKDGNDTDGPRAKRVLNAFFIFFCILWFILIDFLCMICLAKKV